jgi:hydrogenase-4 component B
MGGLLKRMRVTGTVFLIACCSITGLPLFNGFISEWLLFRGFLAASGLNNLLAAIILPLTVGVLALIGGLAAACFAKVYRVAFLGRPRSTAAEKACEVSPLMQWGMIFLAAACIVIGVAPGLFLRPLSATVQEFLPGAALPEEAVSLSALMPIIALSVAFLVIAIAAARRVKKTVPTWACGLPGLNARMQYTSTAFSKPLRKVFARVYKPDRTLEVLPAEQPFFPTSISYSSVRTTSFEKSLYRPFVEAVIATAHRLRRLQTGNMQIYLLYIFAALIALLIFMRWS